MIKMTPRLIIWLMLLSIVNACGSPQPAEAAQKAQSIEFLLSQVRTSVGALPGGKVWTYAAGTTTAKAVWLDRGKVTQAANPYTLDSNATAQLYGDGLYRIVIKDAAGVTKYDRDNISFRDASGLAYDVADYASIAAAVASIGSTPATLQYASDQTLSANLTIPATLELLPLNGAVIIHGTYTISYAGSTARWPLAQIFSGTGAVTGLDESAPEYFAVNTTPGTTDMTAAFNAAARASNKVIASPGIYRFNTSGILNRSNVAIEGGGLGVTYFYGPPGNNDPILSIRDDGWAANSTYPGPRLKNITLSGISFVGAIPTDTGPAPGTQSSRPGLFLGGVGFDFNLEKIEFYLIGRNAIIAEDLWDGDIIGCKFHEVGTDTTWTPPVDSAGVSIGHAIALKRKVDSSNAIRITNSHFEHCKRGALYAQDYCYSLFLTNPKFEAINSDTAYPAITPIYVGDNHRNFTWVGGFAVLTQQNQAIHFARVWGDSTYINTNFTGPTINDGAAVLDLGYGNFGVGPTIRSNMDIRGDLAGGVYPVVVRHGEADFSGSTVKSINPGRGFHLSGKNNIFNNLRVAGVGTAQSSGWLFYQQDPLNRISYALSGVSPNAGYITNQTTLIAIGDTVLALNNSTTTAFPAGSTVDAYSLTPCSTQGAPDPSGIPLVGSYISLGYCPALVAGQPQNSVCLFRRI